MLSPVTDRDLRCQRKLALFATCQREIECESTLYYAMFSKTDLLNILDIIELCLQSTNTQQLDTIVRKTLSCIGLEGAMLGFAQTDQKRNIKEPTIHHVGIHPGWVQVYRENKFVHDDPVVKYAVHSSQPYSWDSAYHHYGDACKTFVVSAKEHGLRSGLTVAKLPCVANDSYSISSFCTSTETIDPWQTAFVSRVIHHINTLVAQHSLWNDVQLSKRESEVLLWSKEGKSYWEISVILNISERTVKFHLSNIYGKLGVSNRSQAVARALQLGLIKL